jgi:type IV secretory pathway TraG/TraD family ATPase VirD4
MKVDYYDGNRLTEFSQIKKEAAALREEQLEGPWPYFGGIRMPYEYTSGNFLLLGGPGTSKSIQTALFIRSMLDPKDQSKAGAALVIHDIKQDMIPLLYSMGYSFEAGTLKTLNPFDARGSRWNIAAAIKDQFDARAWARLLVPDLPDAKEPYWRDASRNIVAATIRALHASNPGNWHFRDLIQFCLYEPIADLRDFLERVPENRAEVMKLNGSPDGSLRDVIETMRTCLAPFAPIGTLWMNAEDSFSVEDWLDGKFVLLLGTYWKGREQMSAINNLFLEQAMTSILARGVGNSDDAKNAKRYLFVLDEFPQLGKIESLPSFLDLSRQYGGMVLAAAQDVMQIQNVYEKQAGSLLGRFRNLGIMRVSDQETAEWASNRFGMQRVRMTIPQYSSAHQSNTIAGESIGSVGSLTKTESAQSDLKEQSTVAASSFMYPLNEMADEGMLELDRQIFPGFFQIGPYSCKVVLGKTDMLGYLDKLNGHIKGFQPHKDLHGLAFPFF